MRDIKDKATSIRQQLYNIAKREGRNLDQLVLLYMQERLLFRMSSTKYSENFILKGGLFLYTVFGIKNRPTKDIDFLAKCLSNHGDHISSIFVEIVSQKSDDALIFDPGSVLTETIVKDADYQGQRVTTPYKG